jgi:competence protein ComEC
MAAISFAAANMAFIFLPLSVKFKLQSLQGILINLLLVIFGLLISWQKDVRHNNNWYGKFYKDTAYIIATINEPLTEKTKSYKADALVESVIVNDSTFTSTGKLLLYFSKDSLAQQLHYGDKILIHKSIQPIKNSGNPGAFNYQRYAAFQQTFHNVFLKDKDWVVLTEKNINPFWQFIYSAKEKILFALQKNISNSKDELGIAEALLIGYTNDLDKDLVQAYSNTGVVHIIAISGMHLALIYVMLVWLFARIPVINKSKGMQVLLIVGCLWLFSLLTGGSASVIRSAVMFTFITIGKMFFKQSSIFNSLAASAFVMLCYNPYYLWDVGFQLSYLAVVGIVIFQKPIYNLFYIKNKWVDKLWQMVAITTAAQLLTFPVCIYYFHQFPLLFLITNLVAVPLSTIILYAEIVLVAFSWIPFVGIIAGKITGWLLALMNTFIVGVNNLSFSVWDKIPATLFTTLLLYAVVVFAAAWLLNKNRAMLRVAMFSLLGFVITHSLMAWKIKEQQKIIVYNVPQHKAIDFVTGNNYLFNGDSVLLEEGLLQNFHLKPGRIALQLNRCKDFLPELFNKENFYQLGKNRIVLIDKPFVIEPPQQKINVDIIIISKNPKLYIPQLAAVFNCQQYVFDASNSLWKIDKWKQDCDKLNLRFHSIPEKGAFVMDL